MHIVYIDVVLLIFYVFPCVYREKEREIEKAHAVQNVVVVVGNTKDGAVKKHIRLLRSQYTRIVLRP